MGPGAMRETLGLALLGLVGLLLLCCNEADATEKADCWVSRDYTRRGPSRKCTYREKFCVDGLHVRNPDGDLCSPMQSSAIGLTGCDDCTADDLRECWKYITEKAYKLEEMSIRHTKRQRQKTLGDPRFSKQCFPDEERYALSSAVLGENEDDFAGDGCDWKPGTKTQYMRGSYETAECPMQVKLCKVTERVIYGATSERWTVSVRHVQMDKNHDRYKDPVSSHCHRMLLDYSENLEKTSAGYAKRDRLQTIENAKAPDEFKEEEYDDDDGDDQTSAVAEVASILNSGSTTYGSGMSGGSGMPGGSSMSVGSLHYGDANEQVESYFTASEYDAK